MQLELCCRGGRHGGLRGTALLGWWLLQLHRGRVLAAMQVELCCWGGRPGGLRGTAVLGWWLLQLHRGRVFAATCVALRCLDGASLLPVKAWLTQ